MSGSGKFTDKQDGDGGNRTKENSMEKDDDNKSTKGYDKILKKIADTDGETSMTATQKRLRSAFRKYVKQEVNKEVNDDAQVLKIMRREHRENDNGDFRRFSVISAPNFNSKALAPRAQVGRQVTTTAQVNPSATPSC